MDAYARGRTEADCVGTKLRPFGDRLGEIGAPIVQFWLPYVR